MDPVFTIYKYLYCPRVLLLVFQRNKPHLLHVPESRNVTVTQGKSNPVFYGPQMKSQYNEVSVA